MEINGISDLLLFAGFMVIAIVICAFVGSRFID